MADVSVVIATRNRALLLKEALDSVLNQSEPVREVIVVDDGSTDTTSNLLSSYGERFRTFSQAHSGPVSIHGALAWPEGRSLPSPVVAPGPSSKRAADTPRGAPVDDMLLEWR